MEKIGLNFTAKKLATATILAIFLVSVDCAIIGEARIECQGKCEDLPDCNEFCQISGFKSGQCYPPFYQYCCCTN
ncbi:hypothetical protein Pfo_016269 [Paulownia fortunei]|nr:hypothetical protein Pfo_016269 [Paulownia fortunei]